MPAGARIVLDGVLYHLIVRGNQKQKVFREERDFAEYIKRVRKYKRKYKFRLYSYCLMPNHIHLMGEIERKENLAKFMQGLNRSYTAYFNDKYQIPGQLWQGRFKSKIIAKDGYLLDCINYIELNPLKANMIKNPYEYQWSSYRERALGADGRGRLLDNLNLVGMPCS